MSETIQTIRPLNSGERQTAREAAHDVIVRSYGEKPVPEDFYQATFDEFPPWLNRLVVGLITFGLIAAFTISMFRVFNIARMTYLETITDFNQATIVGAMAVILGEVMIIIALLARTVLHASKWLSIGTALAALAFTLVGNWTVAAPHTGFGYLEAVLPPVFTVVLAYFLERKALVSVRERYEMNQRYKTAMADYMHKLTNVENNDQWPQAYANALRDALRKKNSRRVEALEAITNTDWRILVDSELDAENWYRQETATDEQLSAIVEEPKPAVLSVIRWFEAHPEAWQMANPAVAEQTNVSKETVRQARLWINKGYHNGHDTDPPKEVIS